MQGSARNAACHSAAVRPGRGALCAGTDRCHQHPADQKRLPALWRRGECQSAGGPRRKRRRTFNGRAVDGGWCTAQFSESFKLVWCFGARRSAYRRFVLCAGTAAGPGTADLQRHSGTGCHGRHGLSYPERPAQKDPRNGEQHP